MSSAHFTFCVVNLITVTPNTLRDKLSESQDYRDLIWMIRSFVIPYNEMEDCNMAVLWGKT